jgi:hypothetical protein
MRSGTRTCLLVLAVAAVLLGVLVDVASASTPAHFSPPMAGLFDFLNPVKNIAELVGKIVGKLFGALAKALMPDFLRDATVRTLQGLVALPNLSDRGQWHNVGALRSGTTAIAWALLPLPFTITALRYLVGTFTDGPHPVMAVWRTGGAAFGLVLYPWAAGQAFTFVNVLTHSLLSLPAVGNGLQRAVTVVFGAAIIAGLATPFLACLALVAIVLGTLLFGLKIAVLMIAALLYVAGPLVIALAALNETSHLYRAWLFAFIALAFIPVGWCLIFAVAGALTLDATSGGISAQMIGKDVTAALAALLSLGIAVMWPKVLIGHALQIAAGMGISVRGVGGGGGSRGSAPVAGRAQSAMRQLRDGTMTAGRGVGRAMGHLGAPAGGAAGWAGRLMARSTPVAAAAGAAAGAATRLGSQVSSVRERAADPSAGRLTKAAGELAGIPAEVRNGRSPASTPVAASSAPRSGSPAAPAGASSGAGSGSSRRGTSSGRRLSAEKRAVLARLPGNVPPRVREAVVRAQPGSAGAAATKAAARSGAPLSAETQRAVFAASASATQRTAGAEVRPSAPPAPRSAGQAPPPARPTPRAPQGPSRQGSSAGPPPGRRPRKPRGGRRS